MPPKAHPSSVYVVSYRDGSTKSFTGAPTATDRWGSRFCYIVDTTEHRVTSVCTVQTAVDGYTFSIEVDAAWRVTDAEAVVRADLVNGNEAVLAWLQDELWQIGRQYPPDHAAAAESAARAALAGIRTFTNGILLLRAAARFSADAHLSEGRITLDQDKLQGQLEQQRLDRLSRLDGSDESAIREHLLRHPEDTGTLLTMLAAGRERNQALHLGILKELLDRKLLTDADVGPLRDFVLGKAHAAPGLSPAPPPAVPARAPLSLPAGISSTATVTASVTTAGPDLAAPAAPGGPDPAAPGGPDPAAPGGPGTDARSGADSGGQPGGVRKWKQLKSPDRGPA